MDLQFLLFLQELRLSAWSLFNEFMLMITNFAPTGAVVIGVMIFWGLDRMLGYWLIANSIGGILLNNILKLTACVYRPWIRFPELTPHPGAIEGATGYSFPSGHTQIASSFFGSLAYAIRQKHRVIAVLCVIMILLTGFSRNYLGVHTPQDVLVSLVSAAVLIAVNRYLFKKMKDNPTLQGKVIAAGSVITVLCILYITFKSYPMDYADGALIVDPVRMKEDGYAAAGGALGSLAGSFIELRYIRFTTSGTPGRKILRLIGGIPFIALLMLVIKNPVYSLVGRSAGHVVIYFVLALYIIAVYPAVFTSIRRKYDQDRDAGAKAP